MIQVILLEKVTNLGDFGKIVRVRSGYARNYLIPKKIATPATDLAIRDFELRRSDLINAQLEKIAHAKAMAEHLSNLHLVISRRTSNEGRLYGSVTTKDIAENLKGRGFPNIRKSCIQLPSGPIKETGEYSIFISLNSDISQEIKVSIKSEN